MLWRAGEKVGQYEIISELGRGGMATVYKAYHTQLDRHVAIKVMHQTFADDSTFLERFNREARIVASLEHPHIVPVYDYAEYNGMPYLVMKFVQGRSLKEILFKKPPTLEEIKRIMTAVGQAITYAHNKGVLHRDIKPSNIILDQDNVPYLADFGLARIVASGESTMSADVLLGTPNYMSPEQARGAKDIDHRSDIYSFGIVLYELVVGQVPFSAQTPLAVIQDHINTPLPRPSQINPEIPQQLEQVLRKALSKSPDKRYNSANDMVADFTRAVENSNVNVLAENRADLADESLAKWRSAYIRHMEDNALVNDDEDSIAQSVRNLAAPSIVDDISVRSPIQESVQANEFVEKPKIQSTTTLVRHEPNGRLWILAGVAIIILSLFLMVAVVLNTSNTFLAIAETIQDLEADANNTNSPDDLMYNIPKLPLNEAQTIKDSAPENPINYLILACAQYEDNDTNSARQTIKQGYDLATDKIRYLANAVSIADVAGDANGAMIFGVLLWDIAQPTTSEQGQLAYNTVSEFLYTKSLQAQEIQVSRANSEQLTELFGEEISQQLIRSQITRIMIVNNHIEMDRARLATATVRVWTEETYALPIGQLVNARYNLLENDTETAINQLNQLVEASTTPAWIVTIAQELITTLEE